jgi:hypothetical protein
MIMHLCLAFLLPPQHYNPPTVTFTCTYTLTSTRTLFHSHTGVARRVAWGSGEAPEMEENPPLGGVPPCGLWVLPVSKVS